MKFVKYIAFLLLLLSGREGWAQAMHPFIVTPSGSNHTIFIKASVNPSINDEPLEAGDVIGVFYETRDGQACGGFTVWNNENTFITAYGADGISDGFKSGEAFMYKIWRSATNCVIDEVTATYNSGGVILNEGTYAENGISELGSLTGVDLLRAENFYVQITQATCIAGGKILVEGLVDNAMNGVELTATNIFGKEYVGESEIVELPLGDYGLSIRKNSCSLNLSPTITIIEDADCEFPVISPNKDGVAEDYYIPYQGTAKIYDRFGALVTEFTIPSTWDATDQAGQILPMGIYVIACEGYEEILITIVR